MTGGRGGVTNTNNVSVSPLRQHLYRLSFRTMLSGESVVSTGFFCQHGLTWSNDKTVRPGHETLCQSLSCDGKNGQKSATKSQRLSSNFCVNALKSLDNCFDKKLC